jgi:hypothetical protein
MTVAPFWSLRSRSASKSPHSVAGFGSTTRRPFRTARHSLPGKS